MALLFGACQTPSAPNDTPQPALISVTPDVISNGLPATLTVRGRHLDQRVTVLVTSTGTTLRFPAVPTSGDSIVMWLPDTDEARSNAAERPPLPLPSGRYGIQVVSDGDSTNTVYFTLISTYIR